jgi:peptidoglycan hydrolase CwlO-like protein
LTAAFAFAVIKISKVLDEQKSQLSNNRGIIQQQNNNVIAELKDNQQRLKETQQTIATQAADLNKMGLRLDRNSADYTKNIAELKNGLKEQRERFATMLEHARKNAAKEQAAELARQRDAFAKQQLAKLHRFETMAANLKKQQEEIAILKLRLSAKQASLDEVMRRANEIKKTVVSPGKKKPVKLVKKRVVAPAKKVIQKATIKPAENLNKSQDKQ